MPLLASRRAAAWKHLCRFPIRSGAFALINFGASLPYGVARLAKFRQVWEIVSWSPVFERDCSPSPIDRQPCRSNALADVEFILRPPCQAAQVSRNACCL